MRRKSNSQVTIAYQHIRDRIISYSLAPGTQISDNSLAKELDMSRAPIREAILLLQMDGLVQLNDQGTMIVSPLSINDVVDILHIRSALESESILLISAGGWLSAERENEMIEIHRQLSSFAQQDTSMNHYMYDDLFHSKLAEYSGSPDSHNCLCVTFKHPAHTHIPHRVSRPFRIPRPVPSPGPPHCLMQTGKKYTRPPFAQMPHY